MKKKQLWQFLALTAVVVFITSGCVNYDASGNPTGWVYEYFGKPAAGLLDFLAGIFGNNYGISIIIVTLITRIFMLPSSIKMTKSTMISQARMKVAQPEIDEIRAEIDATNDPAQKAALNQELMSVYKKYDINMFGGMAGCLPLLIQMPIISAVYAAIRTSSNIQSSTFMGIELGSKSLVLTVLVVLFTFLQSWLMQKQMPAPESAAAAQTSKTMMWMNPILIGWIAFTTDAGLGLYFLTGSVFAIFQQLYTNKIVRPKIQEIIDKDTTSAKATSSRRPRKDITPTGTATDGKKRLVPTKSAASNATASRRNAGKQQRRN